MKKAFTRKPDNKDEEHGHAAEEPARARLAGVKNYITPGGLQRLRDEHRFLLTRERPAVTQVVAWAASNGDRSENADYQYRQTAATPDRSADSLSDETNRCRGSGGPASPEKRAGGDAGVLRGDCSLRQRRWTGASGEHRRGRRSRSEPQTHQLDVATGARDDEVRARRLRGPSRAWKDGAAAHPRRALRVHPRGTVQRPTRGRGRTEGEPSHQRLERPDRGTSRADPPPHKRGSPETL